MTDDCRRTREIGAELALGIAEGQQRAEALEHLATCATCRSEVGHLAATADSLLLIAPSAEPPAGFETAVLNRLDLNVPVAVPRRPVRRWIAVGAAAAAVLLVFVVGLGVGRSTTDRVGPAATLDDVAVGTFAGATGSLVGEVRAISGEPSWLLVTIPGPAASPPLAAGDYRVECIYRNGYSYHAGTLTIDPDDSVAAWSTTVDYRLDDLEQVRLVGADGSALVAAIDHPS